MFSSVYQSGFLSLFNSLGSQPLQLWSEEHGLLLHHRLLLRHYHTAAATGGEGLIETVHDDILHSPVLSLHSDNLATTSITCPADPVSTLSIKLPVVTFVLRNLQQFVSLEVQILDDKRVRRRFRASNFQARGDCTMLIQLVRVELLTLTTTKHAEHNSHQAVYLHHAHAPGGRLELFATQYG